MEEDNAYFQDVEEYGKFEADRLFEQGKTSFNKRR